MNKETNTSIKTILKCGRTLTNGEISRWEQEIEVSWAPRVFAHGVQCDSPRHEDGSRIRCDLIWKNRTASIQGEQTNNKFNARCLDCANHFLDELNQNEDVQIFNPEDLEIIQQELKKHLK